MVKIREAEEKDVERLFDLIMQIAIFHDQEQFVLTDKKELLKAGFEDNSKYGALLAEVDGNVVGYLSYTWNYSIWKGCEYMNLDDLYILEAYRGQKIGNELMLKAREICKNRNINFIKWEVEKDNFKAIEFYKRLGAEINVKGVFGWKF